MRNQTLQKTLLIDLAIAAAIAGLVVVIAPGLAVVGMLALLAAIVGGASFVFDLKPARRRSRPGLQEDH